jgi:hypothetical protein
LHTKKIFFAIRNREKQILNKNTNHCIENNWSNFDENVIAMDEEEWKGRDVKEFTRLVKH